MGETTMKKMLFLLIALPLLAACNGKAVKTSFASSECLNGGAPLSLEGYTVTAVAYGDSYLIVIPISTVHPNSEFRFALAPKRRSSENRDYKTATVSNTSDDDDADTPANWMDVSGTFASDGTLVACVPNIATGQTYKYKVTISDGGGTEYGMLDPRADIIP